MSQYIMLPGARLEVGSKGGLYETLGAAATDAQIKAKGKSEAAAAASSSDPAAAARRQVAKMRRSLKGWLKYRLINDEVAAGRIKATKMPQNVAAAEALAMRDWAGEQRLADELHELLSQIHDPASLPRPDVMSDPKAAVKLAEIAIGAPAGTDVSAPEAQGILPLIILTVGGLGLLTITSIISSRADVQKEKEHLECIKSGACTDFGFWLKAASVVVLSWFAWEKLGIGTKIKGVLK